MTVVVPAVTVAQVDTTGEVVAVETNTGRPPACANMFLLATGAAGRTQPGTLAEENHLMQRVRQGAAAQPGTGAWHAGWHPVSRSGVR
ncbi:MAG TPA: hypothetical protein VHB02_20280 [Acidimicrobiales bacterium]|nr:hypothetical protein [Acidimicrobiales bacterium]